MKKLTLENLDQLGVGNNMVEDLLDQQVREIEAILGESYRGMGNKVLSMFIQNGNRLQLSEAKITETLHLKKALDNMMVQRILEQMLTAKLLQKTPGGKYELSNNLLAQRAFQKVEAENRVLRTMRSTIRDRMARKELLDEHYLNYITSSLDLLELSPEETKFVDDSRAAIQSRKRRRRYLVTLFISALSIMAFWTTLKTFESQRYAKDLEKTNAVLESKQDSLNSALQESDKFASQVVVEREDAYREARRADSLANVAKTNELKAKVEAKRANDEARKALKERTRAETEATKAISASEAAKRAEAAAVESAKRAERLRLEAEKAEDEANLARQRAIVYSNAVVALNAALKSQELDDARLKALVARQAFNIVNNSPDLGLNRHPYIYNALYYAVKDLDPGLRFRNKAHDGSVKDIAFGRNGRRFFTTGSDGKVVQWDVEAWNALGVPAHRQTILDIAGNAVHNTLALSPDENQLLIGGELDYLQVYQFTTRSTRRYPLIDGKNKSKLNDEIYAAQFWPSNGGLFGISRKRIFYFQDETSPAKVLPKLNSTANTFLSTDRGIVPLSAQFKYPSPSNYNAMTEFNIEGLINGKMVRQERQTRQITAQNNYGNLSSLAAEEINGVGLLAFGFQNGQILLGRMDADRLDIDTLIPLFKQNQAAIVDLAFSANGRYLAAASLDGKATIWDLRISQNDPTYQPLILEDHETWATSLCFSPDERFLIVGTKRGELAFWNLEPKVYAEHLCSQLRLRYLGPRYDEMDASDWRRFFGRDIKQQKVCGGN